MAWTFSKDGGGLARHVRRTPSQVVAAQAFAWSGFAIMWLFWISFVVFLADRPRIVRFWPLPTINGGGVDDHVSTASITNLALIALFGVQHSVMARPWFKAWWASSVPAAFQRCAFVHMANLTLLTLIVLWQPIPTVLWTAPDGVAHDAIRVLFVLGWMMLFAGAWSFGIFDLLGIGQMRAWCRGQHYGNDRLRTGRLYRWLRHPMYVGVLLGLWATPRMTVGHLLLAGGFTAYVLIAMRYEERDLEQRFGAAYARWREARQL